MVLLAPVFSGLRLSCGVGYNGEKSGLRPEKLGSVIHMKTTIYLIRHGESLGNLQKRFLGHTDWDLTELGHRQAACTAKLFEDVQVDAVLCSDLLRARHTAQPIAEAKGLPLENDPGFREIFAGDWERREFHEIQTLYPESHHVWCTDIGNAHPDGGETVVQLFERVYAALCRAVENHPDQTIVIGLHATPIRVLLTHFAGLPVERAAEIPWVSNASVTKLVCENGVFTVEYADRHDHLGDISTVFPSNI